MASLLQYWAFPWTQKNKSLLTVLLTAINWETNTIYLHSCVCLIIFFILLCVLGELSMVHACLMHEHVCGGTRTGGGQRRTLHVWNSLSMNLGVGWRPANPSDPLVSTRSPVLRLQGHIFTWVLGSKFRTARLHSKHSYPGSHVSSSHPLTF